MNSSQSRSLPIEDYAKELGRRRLQRRRYEIIPATMPAKIRPIEHISALMWDVYGTLMALSIGDLESALAKKDTMLEAFKRTAKEFDFAECLDGDPGKNLLKLYVHEIEKTHRRKHAHGVFSPEVKIEQIWLRIIKKLTARGYNAAPMTGNTVIGAVPLELAYRVAYFFDDIYQAKVLYPGAKDVLAEIRKLGLRQGIISNAQFYTPISLNLLLRQKRNQVPNPIRHYFDRRLVFFSYRLGVSKPNPVGFERARDRLESMGIEPYQVLYVGNDILNDMIPARSVGFKCALFAGDRESLNLRKDHPDCVGFKPDAIIKSLPQILKIVV